MNLFPYSVLQFPNGEFLLIIHYDFEDGKTVRVERLYDFRRVV